MNKDELWVWSYGDTLSLNGLVAYQIIDANQSAGSSIMRAGVGAMFLGPIGLAAGLTGKKKYRVLLFYKDRFTLKEEQKNIEFNDKEFRQFLDYVAKNNIPCK